MTQAGGPAALNGFLYQIIHHLGWLADVTLTGKLDGQEITDACLVLEPRSGGDARAEASGIHLVEQYKTRESGTWSVTDLEAVLRDLRKAVPKSRPASARYRFVTDGGPGRLDKFKAFLVELKSVAGPDDLDDAEKKDFGNNLSVTNREFFDHIVAATRSGTIQSPSEERSIVFHLLFHFEPKFGASRSASATAVEKLLRHCVPHLGDEHSALEQLVGLLHERLSEGEMQLDAAEIKDMFRYARVNPDRLLRLAVLPETMSALTRRHLGQLKYHRDRDVRAAPKWPEEKPVLVITGESGTGKTWQLGRLLEALGDERQITTLVPVAKTTEDLLSRAACDVWQKGLGETTQLTLVAVSHFLRELIPNSSAPRLIVAIDDVRDDDLVRDLVLQDWANLGMRLVLTVPQDVAALLAMTYGDTIYVHSVGDFSVDELDKLLQASGRRWADLPTDLKELLRRPILAGLFLGLPYISVQSAPRSEYEIFEAFWKRIGRRGDKGIVMALADHMREAKSYPIPRPTWHEIGLDGEETIARLEAAGWLRCTESGEVVFAHDRLLNWAVAKSLVSQFRSKRLPLDRLANLLARETGDQAWYVSQRLGYVLMDTIWLLAADEANTETLGQLVERMESSHQFGSYGEDLYVHLLPTLGQRALPVLLERLKAVTNGSDGDYRVSLIGKALANLACQEDVDLTETIDSMLNAPSWDRQKVAIAALTAAPDARRLDRLWELHQKCLNALDDKTYVSRRGDYQASLAALRAGIELNPGWLRNRILSADTMKEHLSELAYLLNRLEHADAIAIWKEARDTLMAKVPASKPSNLLYCIARFSDREKLEFVIKHLSHREDFAAGAALAALSVLDPLAAIDRLDKVEDFERYVTRNHWLPHLLQTQPELTRQRILELAEADPKGRVLIQNLFWERPDEMDEALLRFMLSALERDLHEHVDDTVLRNLDWLYHPLDFLGRIARLELLAILEAEAGGELERLITAVACSRLHRNSMSVDPVLDGARRVLIHMAGEGITTLIKRELESEHFWIRHGGLNWAFIRADEGIIERLATIARRPLRRDSSGNPDTESFQEFYDVILALAALGADAALVETLWQHGIVAMPPELAALRAHRGPMSKALTDRALQTLQNTASSDDSCKTALVIAWISGDVDFVPAVRSVLDRADPVSRAARFACVALLQLGDRSDDFVRLAWHLAQTEANATWGLNALFSLGDRGLEFLGNWLQSQNTAAHMKDDAIAIRALYGKPATRHLSVVAAVDRCLHGGYFLDAPYDIAGDADEAALREQILDKAFAARSFVTTEPLRAIEGLAKFDARRAVEAIELGLRSHHKIERQLCRLLIRIAPETAAEKLVNAAISIERDSLRRAAGRALRRLDPEVVSRLIIERMTGSDSERKAAAELSGWLSIPAIMEALGHLADHDSATKVRHAALAALDLHRREASIRELLASFPSAVPERRWSLLVAIVEVADPYLLTDREEPLWLGKILSDDVPAAFAHYAESVLSQRKQKEN